MSLRPPAAPYGFLSSLTEQPIQANPMPLSDRSGSLLKTINNFRWPLTWSTEVPRPKREICAAAGSFCLFIMPAQNLLIFQWHSENGTPCNRWLFGRRRFRKLPCAAADASTLKSESLRTPWEPAHCCRVRAAGRKQNDRGRVSYQPQCGRHGYV